MWDEAPLFQARIEAWANGPVAPELYRLHKGKFQVSDWPRGKIGNLTKDEKETIDAVLEYYGDKSSQWLKNLTHLEAPWKDARKGIPPGARSTKIISHASMFEYYDGI